MSQPPPPLDLLEKLKALPLSEAEIRVVFARRRYPTKETLAVSLHSTNAQPKLIEKIRDVVSKRLEQSNSIEDYEPEVGDTDKNNGLMLATHEESHWDAVGDKLLNDKKVSAEKVSDLKGADMMIADFIFEDDTRLFAVTKLPEPLTARRLGQRGMLFNEGKIELLEEDEKVLAINFRVDFLAFDGHVFVANKKDFETAMNIREGMIKKRDALLEKVETSQRFNGVEHLREYIQTNLTLLKRASKAVDSGNVEDADFYTKLHQLLAEHPEFDVVLGEDGKVEITKKNAETVLYLLNDARAETLINKRLMDIKTGIEVKSSG